MMKWKKTESESDDEMKGKERERRGKERDVSSALINRTAMGVRQRLDKGDFQFWPSHCPTGFAEGQPNGSGPQWLQTRGKSGRDRGYWPTVERTQRNKQLTLYWRRFSVRE